MRYENEAIERKFQAEEGLFPKLSRQKGVHCVAFDALEEERVNPRRSDDREMLDKPYTTKDRKMENIQNRQWRKKINACQEALGMWISSREARNGNDCPAPLNSFM